MICDNLSKGILDTLQFVLIETLQDSKQRVTVVQTTTNQGICSKNSQFRSKILFYSLKVTHLEKACSETENSALNHIPRFFDKVKWMKKASKNTDRKV